MNRAHPLALRFHMLRRSSGTTQKALGQEIGISQKHISELETGKKSLLKVQGETLVNLARVFGTSVDYLLGVTDNPEPHAALPAAPAS